MKTFKKLMAAALVACMLFGVLVTPEVAATGNTGQAFTFASAYEIPQTWATRAGSLDRTKSLSLYFTGAPLAIDTAKVKAVLAIVGKGTNEAYNDEVYNGTPCLTGTLVANTAQQGTNNYAFVLSGSLPVANLRTVTKTNSLKIDRSVFTGDIDTIEELVKLADMSMGRLVLRLIDISESAGDGLIDGITKNTTTLLPATMTCAENGNTGTTRDAASVNVSTYENGEIRLTSAVFDETARTLTLGFSGIVQYSGRAGGDQYCGIRVVNNLGLFMGYDPATDTFGPFDGGKPGGGSYSTTYTSFTAARDSYMHNNMRSHITSLTADNVTAIKGIIQRVEQYNETVTAEQDKLRVVYLIQEGDQSKLKTDLGDYQYNGYVDTMWRQNSGAPMVADHTLTNYNIGGRNYNQRDVAMVVLTTPEQMAAQDAVTMTSAQLFDTATANAYMVMTFSEAVKGFNTHIDGFFGRSKSYYLSVFNAKDQQMYNNNGTLGTSGTQLRWQIEDVRMHDTEGKKWIGTVKGASDKGGKADYASIMSYLGTLKTESGAPLVVDGALADGYVLQASIWDEVPDSSNPENSATGGIRWSCNALVDHITSLDGQRKLYAACHDAAGAREQERAVCNVTDGGSAPSITSVKVYNEHQYLITFNVPTVMSGSNYYPGLRVTGSDGAVTANPAGGNYQWRLNFAPYGEDGTQYIATVNEKSYSEIKAIADGLGKSVRVVFEDSDLRRNQGVTLGRNRGVNGIYAKDNADSYLLANNANGWGDRACKNVEAVTEPLITLDKMEAKTANRVTAYFSDEVASFDGLTVTLEDGGEVYTCTDVSVSGREAGFTFPVASISPKAVLRIAEANGDSLLDVGVQKKLFANLDRNTAGGPITAMITVESTEQISRNELVVTFSEAITSLQKAEGGAYMGMRVLDEAGRLVWTKRDATGTTVLGSEGDGVSSPMQVGALYWEYTDESQRAIKVVFPQLIDIAALVQGTGWPVALAGYQYWFVIEEKADEALRNDWRISDITAKDDPTKQLEATHTGEDRFVSTVTNLMYTDCITVSDAEITGENEVSFRWSHAVNLGIKNEMGLTGIYYAGFRFVSDAGVLYWYNPVTGKVTTEEATKDAAGNRLYSHYLTGEVTTAAKDGTHNNTALINTPMQWGAYLAYTDNTNTKMTAHITPSSAFGGVYSLEDLVEPTGELKALMDQVSGRIILRIQEKNDSTQGITCSRNGQIESFSGKDGTGIMASPYQAGIEDGLDLELVGELIRGGLKVTKTEILSDTEIRVTFSAAISFVQSNGEDAPPFVGLRLYTADNKLIFWNPYLQEYTTTEAMLDENGKQLYRNQNGYTLEKEGVGPQGTWINFGRQVNTAMQWKAASWRWADASHTAIIYTVSGGEQLPVKNITDILNYDFTKFIEGSYVALDFEEDSPGMIASNGHVDNIVRADDARIALDANFFPHSRDSVKIDLDEIAVLYKPRKITSTTTVLNDRQIRVTFTEPVKIGVEPFMAIRMIDKDGNLMWSGKENISTPYQWKGSWAWDDESHTSLTWTMNAQGHLGGITLWELANWKGALSQFKADATWMFVIEEEDDANTPIGRHNRLVDNVVSLDGTNHLYSTYSKGLDGILTELDMSVLVGELVEVISAVAENDHVIRVKFSEPIEISEGALLGVRYLTVSGDSDVLTNGKTAFFKGIWKYSDDKHTEILWTLESPYADSLTDIFNYNGDFEWNKGSRVAFVILDEEEMRAESGSLRIMGVTDKTGVRHLKANYAGEDYPMVQQDITIDYELPAPIGGGEELDVKYVSNYLPYLIAAVGIAAVGVLAVCLIGNKRKGGEGR